MEYTANSIDFLEGLTQIRRRPDMYIGSPSGNPSSGLYRLCREAIDNSIDEYLVGVNKEIIILYDTLSKKTTVIDNGRGIPVGWNEKAKKNSLTLVMSQIHAGGKFDHDSYKTSSGKNGVGIKAITALSEYTQVWSNNSEDKKWYTQSFSRGKSLSDVNKTKLPDEYRQYVKRTGTIISWIPDKEIFTDSIELHTARLIKELTDIQYLCPRLNIRLFIDNKETNFYSEKGLEELVSKRQKDETIFSFADDTMSAAINFTTDEGNNFKSYVNVCYTNLGGTHLSGFKKTICNIIKSMSKVKILNEDILEGMIGAIHCHIAEPQYQGQTKNELTNSEVEKQVIDKLTPVLTKFFRKNRDLAGRIITYAEKMLAEKQKMKASKDLLKGLTKLNNSSRFISDKFLDADRRKYKNPLDLEMFIVEGDSAGGHFSRARESYQAALKIRGKIINAAKASPEDLFGSKRDKNEGNKEIRSIVSALGCGIGDDYDESKLRFGKVIILSDADVDGQHIANLILSFFITYMPNLIKNGHVYIVNAPLFIGNSANGKEFGMTRAEVDAAMKAKGVKDYDILRLKGWGECNTDQLSEICLDKTTRKLVQIKWTDTTEKMLEQTMGNDVAFRKELLGVK